MRKLGILFVGLFSVGFGTIGGFGCAKSGPLPQTPTGVAGGAVQGAANLTDEQLAATDGATDGAGGAGKEPADRNAKRNGTWIGAAAEGDLLSSTTRETFLGVWVDVPEVRAEVRPPMDVVLVVDTSGSMAGSKIESARAAATTLVRQPQGRRHRLPRRVLRRSAHARLADALSTCIRAREILRQIAQLVPTGSTNMFSGLSLAESQMASAPASHGAPPRRR